MLSNQEKKEYLNRYRSLDRKINRLLEELERWQSLATKITPCYSLMPKGNSNSDKLQTAVDNIIELQDVLNKKTDKYIDMRKDIDKAIDTVEDDTLQLLLCYRYIDNLTWEQVAVKMNYSYMQVCRLHGKALSKVRL